MSRMLWFGTENHERWIPMPKVGATFVRVGSNSKTGSLNGGVRVRKSKASHMEYAFDFGETRTRDEIRPILDFESGAYDDADGVNPIYFVTPDAEDKNAAPSAWSFCAQAGIDAMPLFTNNLRPILVATAANTLDYPARTAVYTVAGTEVARKLYLPIQPGYVAWVGFHGSATGATGITVTPQTGATPGSVTTLTPLAVTDTTRVNASFSRADGFTGIKVQAKVGAGTLTATAIIIQMLPIGVTPSTGGWISGQGHSGCQFEEPPVQTVYTVTSRLENVGLTCKLVETADYL